MVYQKSIEIDSSGLTETVCIGGLHEIFDVHIVVVGSRPKRRIELRLGFWLGRKEALRDGFIDLFIEYFREIWIFILNKFKIVSLIVFGVEEVDGTLRFGCTCSHGLMETSEGLHFLIFECLIVEPHLFLSFLEVHV